MPAPDDPPAPDDRPAGDQPPRPDDPPWDRLPHDPQGFFDLPDDADVRTLKRAYNRLLRRFKPEKFPAEFQRIREAYEQLSEQLRYGAAAAVSLPSKPDDEPQQATQSELPADAPAAHVQSLDALLESFYRGRSDLSPSEPPNAALLQTQLLQQGRRWPREYLALAVLSDMLSSAPATPAPEADPRSFCDWLLEGLRKFPDDPGLGELLKEYLSGELAAETRSQLLVRAAEVLPPRRFYLLTERAWDRLLQQLPFEPFRQTFARCQVAQGPTTTGRLVFYVHLLRAAIWKADEDWIDAIRAELEDSFFQLPSWTQYEMECLDALISYRQVRSRFAELSETARKIDQAIVTYYSAPESEGDWAVLECQYAIAERGLFLAGDFPLDDGMQQGRNSLLQVWQTVTSEVQDRLGAETLELQPDALTEPVQQLMVRMQKRASKTRRHSFGNMMLFAGLGVILVALVTTVCYLIRSVMDFFNVGILAGLADLGLAVLAVIGGALVGLVLAIIGVKRVTLLYGDVRLELLNLFRIQPLTVSQMAKAILATEDTKYDGQSISDTKVVAQGMRRDLAANLFAISLRTLATAEE